MSSVFLGPKYRKIRKRKKSIEEKKKKRKNDNIFNIFSPND